MKDFDENSYCPKCHSDDISSQWIGETDYYFERPFGDTESREHIIRRCKRCRYKWNEMPLDISAAHAALEKKNED